MPRQVLDASALLAYLFNEAGAAYVEQELFQGVLISAVNLREVFAKLEERGIAVDMAAEQFHSRGLFYALEIVDFDLEQAKAAASFKVRGKKMGLSLGDRACLALASIKGAAAITADKSWKQLQDVEVKVIR